MFVDRFEQRFSGEAWRHRSARCEQLNAKALVGSCPEDRWDYDYRSVSSHCWIDHRRQHSESATKRSYSALVNHSFARVRVWWSTNDLRQQQYEELEEARILTTAGKWHASAASRLPVLDPSSRSSRMFNLSLAFVYDPLIKSMKSFKTSSRFFLQHNIKGVNSLSSFMAIEAPLFNNTLTIATWPSSAAACKPVRLYRSISLIASFCLSSPPWAWAWSRRVSKVCTWLLIEAR